MTQQHRILVVDDDPAVLASLRLLLKTEGFAVTTATSPEEALFFANKQDFELVLADLNYSLDTTSGVEGIGLVAKLKAVDAHLAVVVMTGWATIDVAVQTMQKGAGDFIQKPWDNDRLLSILRTQIQLAQSGRNQDKLSEENQLLKQQIASADDDGFVAESAQMKQLLATCEQIAQTDINLLITGENGTGKSLLARHIHSISSTQEGPFVSVNMGAITETLFESEMFGHVKGAFTDAKSQRLGRFELAHGGTLFMDEIGNIPLSQQAKLLRVIEEQQFEKVGSSKTQHCQVRVLSATNANLEQMAADKQFRMDLLYRLNTMTIHLPPLRERAEDIAPMAARMLQRISRKHGKPCPLLSDEALAQMQQYDWPGNVRELSHVLERAVLLCVDNDTPLTPGQLMLPGNTLPASGQPNVSPSPVNTEQTLEEVEKQLIIERLNHHQGNAVNAAKSLGLSRSAFYRRLEKYGI